MTRRKAYTQAGLMAAVTLLALTASALVAPGARLAQQNMNNSNSKPSKTKTVTPTRSTPPVKSVNSNKSTQPPPTAKETAPTVKKSTKVGEADKTTYTKPTHRYVITEIDTKNHLTVRVRVQNRGGARSNEGLLRVRLGFISIVPTTWIKEVAIPMTSWFECGWNVPGSNPGMGLPGTNPIRTLCGQALIPPIDPGNAVWVEEKFPPHVKAYMEELDVNWGKYISSIQGMDPTKIRAGFRATASDGAASPDQSSFVEVIDGGFWIIK